MMKPSDSSTAADTSSKLQQEISEASVLLREGRLAEASNLGRTLVQAYPKESRAYAFAAEASNLDGNLPQALSWIDKAIEFSDDPQHKIKKAWLLSRALRRDEIPALAAQASAQAGRDARLFWQIGKLYYHHNMLPEAIAQFERALTAAGKNAAWSYDLGLARFYSGDMNRAEIDLNNVLAAAPQAGAVLYLRSTLRRQTPESNHVAELERHLSVGFRKDEDQAGALYALAKELEDLGEHEKSFAALSAGASKKRGTIKYDISSFRTTMDEIRDVQHAKALAMPVACCEEEGAIFIVGMPRTGTTLAQRILLQSGKVKDAGELLDFGFHLTAAVQKVCAANPGLSPAMATLAVDFSALGETYMRGARQMAGGSPSFIDKLPVNYLYCGLIHKALPKARILHMVRDPLDTCYAIFKTLFFNAYDFSYDLEELAEYYVGYRRMMQHWHEEIPGVILDVRYEDLVTNTEAEARRIYDWCGLEWNAEALNVPDRDKVFATASAAQVREPVHARSVNSSRKHVDELARLSGILAAAVILGP